MDDLNINNPYIHAKDLRGNALRLHDKVVVFEAERNVITNDLDTKNDDLVTGMFGTITAHRYSVIERKTRIWVHVHEDHRFNVSETQFENGIICLPQDVVRIPDRLVEKGEGDE